MKELASEEVVWKQWKDYPSLTSLNLEKEFLGILCIDSKGRILWKQTNRAVEGELLASLMRVEENSEIKFFGALIY